MIDIKVLVTKILESLIKTNTSQNYITIGNFAMCWGRETPASINNQKSVSFPITFAAAPYGFATFRGDAKGNTYNQITVKSESTTGMTVYYYEAGGAVKQFNWLALGFIGGGYFLALFSTIERWWRDVEIKGPACSNTPNRFSDRVWNKFRLDLQEIREWQTGSGTCLERRTGYDKHNGILNMEKRWNNKYTHTANDDKWFSLCFFNGRLKQFRNSIRAYIEHIICHCERDECERDTAKRNTCATNCRGSVEVVLVRGCVTC